MALPATPDAETREQLLDVIAELVARAGAAPFLLPPVMPGSAAFPEPWAPTRAGVALLLRRLMWHAAIERAVVIDDHRAEGAPPTERKPATRVEVVEVRKSDVLLSLGLVGADEVVGTLAHEVGVVYAVLHRPDEADPYRTAESPVIAVDADVDLERGSIATVYLGLGVLAANAAFQQYSGAGRFNGGYVPHEYDVLRAGYVPMSALAYLLAVQAVVRGDSTPPAGLDPPQRDEVAAWIAALPERALLCIRLGIPADAPVPAARPPVLAFDDIPLEDEGEPRKTAFRWHTHRAGVGMIAGTVLGIGVAVLVSRVALFPYLALGGGTSGFVVGRRVHRPRCSGCATIVAADTKICPACGAMLRGDIASLAERLDAEERLSEADNDQRPDV